ncbi:hypothetical protein CAP36_15740 [Chitinophagaceae bacterium IBVUCB2]|nr:hypothetical protein CAP36_15740 [Chitinophagaceae bacterium IBVUCB2]
MVGENTNTNHGVSLHWALRKRTYNFMKKKFEIKLLRSIKVGKGLIKLVNNLRLNRRKDKISNRKRTALTKKQREIILAKTDSHCHMCGIEIALNGFQANHVKPHSTGGNHAENNYLPSCATCNKLRANYSSEEIQVVLKLGVWAKSKVLDRSDLAMEIANEFVKHDMKLRKRRKKN